MRTLLFGLLAAIACSCSTTSDDDGADGLDAWEAGDTDTDHGDGHPEDGDGMEIRDGRT
jgi:hypothetical protein